MSLIIFGFGVGVDGEGICGSCGSIIILLHALSHTHTLSHSTSLYVHGHMNRWGGGMYGKLGHGNESGHSTPRRVEALVGLTIVDIACGSRHTAVVTNKGCLYT